MTANDLVKAWWAMNMADSAGYQANPVLTEVNVSLNGICLICHQAVVRFTLCSVVVVVRSLFLHLVSERNYMISSGAGKR